MNEFENLTLKEKTLNIFISLGSILILGFIAYINITVFIFMIGLIFIFFGGPMCFNNEKINKNVPMGLVLIFLGMGIIYLPIFYLDTPLSTLGFLLIGILIFVSFMGLIYNIMKISEKISEK